ncbi:MAG TPA: gamma-glutamyl-gamma-aminobutyrate hydrolase family protein, partial [Gemmatales bacterium]|nr:gamma-glutamyl-gamma-aminobutyrate hydrolase family protein [Gemmatales bacterium]
FTDDTLSPVICMMSEQEKVQHMGGTMRLGNYPTELLLGSKSYEAYGKTSIEERHRHRYEFNNQFRSEYTDKGFILSGLSPDGKLVEVIELRNHPWFVAVQYHPEFKSKPTQAHPLFKDFVKAARDRRKTQSSLVSEASVAGSSSGAPVKDPKSIVEQRSASYSC